MHDLDIIKINGCLVAKNLLTNVTKTNEHSNVATFVHALVCLCMHMYVCMCVSTIDRENFVVKKVTWDKSSTHSNFVEAESDSMYGYTKSYITKNFCEF